MTIPPNRIRSVSAATGSALQRQAQAHLPSGKGAKAFALQSKAVSFTRGVLYKLLTAVEAARAAFIPALRAHLLREIPKVFGRIPLRPADFGFQKVEHFVQFLLENVQGIESSASTLRDFVKKDYLAGLRWNLVGKVLFERLVKSHGAVHRVVLEWAKEFTETMVNAEIRQRGFIWMLDTQDFGKRVTAQFGPPQKVIEFKLKGGENVRAEFTDFGTMAVNPDADVLLVPIELKMPSAMSGAKEQQADFKTRLAAADSLIAVLENGTEVPIDPKRVVFDKESTHHVAVTLYTKRRWEKDKLVPIDASGKRLFDVSPVSELKPVVNPLTGTPYYALRLTVLRDWLVELVKPVTDPKP